MPAVYTHCYDSSGTRLFAAGGPLQNSQMVTYIFTIVYYNVDHLSVVL
jgi:hypothetical protein